MHQRLYFYFKNKKMLDFKKENTSVKNNPEIIEEDIPIHTMQEDIDALSGIFPKNKQTYVSEEEKKAIFKENKPEVKNGQYFNPFLGKQTEQERNRIVDFADKKVVSSQNIPNKQELQENIQTKSFSKKWILITSIIVVVTGSSAYGGYYYFNKKNIAQKEARELEDQKLKEAEVQESQDSEDVVVEERMPLKYSFDKPNYLSIDTENPSYENFKEIMSRAFSDIKDPGINKPVEFVITDNKNNPIAFPIFSAITKLKLSNELLKNLSDDFSIFAYNDSGNPRLVLLVKVIDKLKANAVIKSEEVKLPGELMPLFLSDVSLPKEKVVFQEANYKGVNIRYFNLTPNQTASIDYSFDSTHLIIATSKNSMWAVLDKILDEGE